MDMIFHSANAQGFHFVLARDATQVGPKALLQVGSDESATFLGAEHHVHMA